MLSQIWSQPPGSDLGVLCAPATWHLAYFFSAQGLPDQRLAVARQNGELLHEEGGAGGICGKAASAKPAGKFAAAEPASNSPPIILGPPGS